MSELHRLLPREGLYMDPDSDTHRKSIRHPIPNLILLGLFQLNSSLRSVNFLKITTYTTILSVTLWLNDLLSKGSRNNWTTDPTWDWKREIVVVTGGSGGIGGSIIQKLARDGWRVVVLDIMPLKYHVGKIVHSTLLLPAETWWDGLNVVNHVLLTGGEEEIFRDHIGQFVDVLKRRTSVELQTYVGPSETHDVPLMDFAARRIPSMTSKMISEWIIARFRD